jgi:hypothetical protein
MSSVMARVSAMIRPQGSTSIALPVRTSSSSRPTPLLNTMKIPLSWARGGRQRSSHSRPVVPRNASSTAPGSVARFSHTDSGIGSSPNGIIECVPPV